MDPDQQWVGARPFFEALREHAGPDAHAAIVTPWLGRVAEYRAELMAAAGRLCRPTFEGPAEERRDLVWELYALSRVSDVLLLAFQPPPAGSSGDKPWDPLEQWPALTMSQYLDLFTRLGMVPFEETAAFDPFLHEIVDVQQTESPDEPLRISEVVWPGLWLGPLLFSRAGVRVRAGAHHAEHGVADRSPLYWTFLRRHRPTIDQSLGWGHNSQWRTDFRIDYRTASGEHINADGQADIDAVADLDPLSAQLTPDERSELLRHRCLVRTPTHGAELAVDPDRQSDLYPFDWRVSSTATPSRTPAITLDPAHRGR
jgi:hypothetical protein